MNISDYYHVASYFNQVGGRKEQKARQAQEDKVAKDTTDLFGKFMGSKKDDFSDVDVSGMDPEAVRRAQIQATGTRMEQLNWSQQSMAMQQQKWTQKWQLANEQLQAVQDRINKGDVAGGMDAMLKLNNELIPNGMTIKKMPNGNYQIYTPSNEIQELPLDGLKPLDALEYLKGNLKNQEFYVKGGLAYREAARKELLNQYMKGGTRVVNKAGDTGYAIFETGPDSMEPAWKVYDHMPSPTSKPLTEEEAAGYDLPGTGKTYDPKAWPDSEYVMGPDGKPYKNPHAKADKPAMTPQQAYKRITELATLKAKIEQGAAAIASFIQSNPDSFMNASPEFQMMLQLFSSKADKGEVSEGTMTALNQAIDQEKQYMESFIQEKPPAKALTREEAMKYYSQATQEILKGVPAEQQEAKEMEMQDQILKRAREMAAADGR